MTPTDKIAVVVWRDWTLVVGQLPDPYDAKELERIVAAHTRVKGE